MSLVYRLNKSQATLILALILPDRAHFVSQVALKYRAKKTLPYLNAQKVLGSFPILCNIVKLMLLGLRRSLGSITGFVELLLWCYVARNLEKLVNLIPHFQDFTQLLLKLEL